MNDMHTSVCALTGSEDPDALLPLGGIKVLLSLNPLVEPWGSPGMVGHPGELEAEEPHGGTVSTQPFHLSPPRTFNCN